MAVPALGAPANVVPIAPAPAASPFDAAVARLLAARKTPPPVPTAPMPPTPTMGQPQAVPPSAPLTAPTPTPKMPPVTPFPNPTAHGTSGVTPSSTTPLTPDDSISAEAAAAQAAQQKRTTLEAQGQPQYEPPRAKGLEYAAMAAALLFPGSPISYLAGGLLNGMQERAQNTYTRKEAQYQEQYNEDLADEQLATQAEDAQLAVQERADAAKAVAEGREETLELNRQRLAESVVEHKDTLGFDYYRANQSTAVAKQRIAALVAGDQMRMDTATLGDKVRLQIGVMSQYNQNLRAAGNQQAKYVSAQLGLISKSFADALNPLSTATPESRAAAMQAAQAQMQSLIDKVSVHDPKLANLSDIGAGVQFSDPMAGIGDTTAPTAATSPTINVNVGNPGETPGVAPQNVPSGNEQMPAWVSTLLGSGAQPATQTTAQTTAHLTHEQAFSKAKQTVQNYAKTWKSPQELLQQLAEAPWAATLTQADVAALVQQWKTTIAQDGAAKTAGEGATPTVAPPAHPAQAPAQPTAAQQAWALQNSPTMQNALVHRKALDYIAQGYDREAAASQAKSDVQQQLQWDRALYGPRASVGGGGIHPVPFVESLAAKRIIDDPRLTPVQKRIQLERAGVKAADAIRAVNAQNAPLPANEPRPTPTTLPSGGGGGAQPRRSGRMTEGAAAVKAAREHHVPIPLFLALITAESNGRANARSSAGAMGATQLMPDTAKAEGVRHPYDFTDNVDGGANHLHALLQHFRGNVPYAVAAYNAGSGAVAQALHQWGAHWLAHLPAETQAYVQKVLSSANAMTAAIAPLTRGGL